MDSKCTFCGSQCFKLHTLSHTELFWSWTVKCGISLNQVLDLESSAQVSTKKGSSCRYCLTCFQLVLDVDFFLDGIRRFESLLSYTTAQLQSIIQENKLKEASNASPSVKEEAYDEKESVGTVDSVIDSSNCEVNDDDPWNNDNEEERSKSVRRRRNTRVNKSKSALKRHRPHSQYGEPEPDLPKELEFPCRFTDCHVRFADQFTLSQHIHRKHHRGKRSSCQFCGLTFSQDEDGSNDLEQHEGTHRLADIPFSCVLTNCSSSFTNFHDLKRHVLEMHEVTVLRCDLCPGKFFRTLFTLKSHRDRVHAQKTEDEGLKCVHPGCSFIASCGSRLQNHISTHNIEKPYVCDACGSTYKTRGTLKRHQFTHTGETPFKCKYCSKSFNMGHKLKNHEETHAPSLSYLCSECGKPFRSKKNLFQHTTFHCPTRVTRPNQKRVPRHKKKHEELITQDNLNLQLPQGSDDLGLLEDGQLHILRPSGDNFGAPDST